MALCYGNCCWCYLSTVFFWRSGGTSFSQRLSLSNRLITQPRCNAHPQTSDKWKKLQRRVFFLHFPSQIYLWHDVINNSLSHPPSDPRFPVTANELVTEVLKLKRVAGIVYCVRRGASDIYKELKATGIPVWHIVKDLLSKCKNRDKRVQWSYSKLHLRPFLGIRTLTFVRNYGSNLWTIIKKKQNRLQKLKRMNQSLKMIQVNHRISTNLAA